MKKFAILKSTGGGSSGAWIAKNVNTPDRENYYIPKGTIVEVSDGGSTVTETTPLRAAGFRIFGQYVSPEDLIPLNYTKEMV